MKKKVKKPQKKVEASEDWCFACKDGGLLIVCEYKKCRKAYHPDCAGKDNSFLQTGNSWTCNWHSCFICHKTPHYQCLCCPNAVCRSCFNDAEFVNVRGKKGFCNNCLKLALLVEEKKDVDSDGGTVDFKDRETYEGLFMEYWEIINEKERLTVENLRSAYVRMKMERNKSSDSDSSEQDKDQLMSDYDNMNDIEHKPERKRKRFKGRGSLMKRKLKSNKKEFIGWGSKSLIQFLASIGKDTSKKLSQHDVTSIINGYVKENNLLHPQKKKKVICDARLRSVLGRQKVNKERIYDLLEAHFAENLEQSEEDDLGYSSEDKDADILFACKRQRKSRTDRGSQKMVTAFNIPQICFAAIVAENIKLVYLKKSLVQELLEHPQSFESKIIGSFVRLKSDLNDCVKKNSHQLVQVTGIERTSGAENETDIFLQVSDNPKYICISVLSDDDFSEEECEDLRQKVKAGLLKKLTIDELEQKAKILHEDITKHWIARELALLQNRIDRANEKGWRRELYECLERRQLLQTSAEQSRLLQRVPTVIPDAAELVPISEDVKEDKQGDEGSPKSILVGSSEIPNDNLEGNGISSGDGAFINGNSSTGNIELGSANDGDGSGQAINVDTAAEVTEGDGASIIGNSSTGTIELGSANDGDGSGQAINVNTAAEVTEGSDIGDGAFINENASTGNIALCSANDGDGSGQAINVNTAAEVTEATQKPPALETEALRCVEEARQVEKKYTDLFPEVTVATVYAMERPSEEIEASHVTEKGFALPVKSSQEVAKSTPEVEASHLAEKGLALPVKSSQEVANSTSSSVKRKVEETAAKSKIFASVSQPWGMKKRSVVLQDEMREKLEMLTSLGAQDLLSPVVDLKQRLNAALVHVFSQPTTSSSEEADLKRFAEEVEKLSSFRPKELADSIFREIRKVASSIVALTDMVEEGSRAFEQKEVALKLVADMEGQLIAEGKHSKKLAAQLKISLEKFLAIEAEKESLKKRVQELETQLKDKSRAFSDLEASLPKIREEEVEAYLDSDVAAEERGSYFVLGIEGLKKKLLEAHPALDLSFFDIGEILVENFADEKKHDGHVTETSAHKELLQHSHFLGPDVQHYDLQSEHRQVISEENQNCSKALNLEELLKEDHILAPQDKSIDILQGEQHQYSSPLADAKQNQPTDVEQGTEKSQETAVQLTENDGDDASSVAIGKSEA